MLKSRSLLGFVLLAAGFLLWNRAAYHGYFQADELDNLNLTSQIPAADFVRGILTPRFLPQNFRPVGHGWFWLAGQLFQLDFVKYIALLHAIHLLNFCLLWVVIRQLGASRIQAGVACTFFAFHMALFDAFWKPMYVFDVLCATFCLLSLLAWSRRKWIWSFAAFWLAYKCKELAVMLPLLLAAYEWWFGKRRWKPLLPFFAASLSFGLQGLLLNPNADNDYTFRFTPAALARTSVFYAGRAFLIPYLGFAVLAGFLTRARNLWFGILWMLLFFLPLLFLPGRMYAAYCYTPFVGLAMAAGQIDPRITLPLLILWAPLDLRELRADRRATLTLDDQVCDWVTAADRFAHTVGAPAAVVLAGHIGGFADYGENGALRYVFHNPGLRILDARDQNARPLIDGGAPVLLWDSGFRRLIVQRRAPGTRDLPYLDMEGGAPVWQLGPGWHDLEGNFRWTDPDASARLDRPEGARRFALQTIVVRPVTVRVRISGAELAPHRFEGTGWQTAEWELPPAPAGPVEVEFQCDTRPLGIPVGGFGFPN